MEVIRLEEFGRGCDIQTPRSRRVVRAFDIRGCQAELEGAGRYIM